MSLSMRCPRGVVGASVAALVIAGSLTACSGGSEPKLTNDEAVSRLLEEGYTPESAQCLIDGASHQNVDVLEFLARDKYTQHESDVIGAVGSYCIEHYGATGTSLPSTTP
jgi:hypothetical protein